MAHVLDNIEHLLLALDKSNAPTVRDRAHALSSLLLTIHNRLVVSKENRETICPILDHAFEELEKLTK